MQIILNDSGAVKCNPQLALKRILAAPREVVFRAWTNPEIASKWWGPHGFTARFSEWDPRAGGTILIQMLDPEGKARRMYGQFIEVVEHRRLVFDATLETPDGKISFEARNTVTFDELGPAETELKFEVEVMQLTAAARGSLAGMEMGWTQSLERLETLCKPS